MSVWLSDELPIDLSVDLQKMPVSTNCGRTSRIPLVITEHTGGERLKRHRLSNNEIKGALLSRACNKAVNKSETMPVFL